MKHLPRKTRRMTKGWILYLALVTTALFAHACALERDQAAEQITSKAASGRSA